MQKVQDQNARSKVTTDQEFVCSWLCSFLPLIRCFSDLKLVMNQTEMQLNEKYSLPAVQNTEIKMISHSTLRWKSVAQKRNGVPPSSYTVNWPKPTKDILWLEFWNFCTSCPSLLHYAFAATKIQMQPCYFSASKTLPVSALLVQPEVPPQAEPFPSKHCWYQCASHKFWFLQIEKLH